MTYQAKKFGFSSKENKYSVYRRRIKKKLIYIYKKKYTQSHIYIVADVQLISKLKIKKKKRAKNKSNTQTHNG